MKNIINQIQNEIVQIVGNKYNLKRLKNVIKKDPRQYQSLLARYTLGFCCDQPEKVKDWRILKKQFLFYYREELDILFPGNAFLSQPIAVNRKLRKKWLHSFAEMYWAGGFPDLDLMGATIVFISHYNTRYSFNTIYYKLARKE